MSKKDLLYDLLDSEKIKLKVQIEELGSELAANFIKTYLYDLKDPIDFDDFRNLIKLSVGFSNDEKLDILQNKEAIYDLENKITAYQKNISKLDLDIKKLDPDENLAWRNCYTSPVSRNALLSVNLNKNKIINNELLPKFLSSFEQLIREIAKNNLNKQAARLLYVEANFELPTYITGNTLANILFVLKPQAFPLTNDWVRKQFKKLLNLQFVNSAEGYIQLASSLDKIADEYNLPKDFSMALFDRSMAEYKERNSDHQEINTSDGDEALKQVAVIDDLNIILHGVPGTGKTYHTRELAVKLSEPEWYGSHQEDRDAIKSRYDELSNLKQARIQFITFHQSFSYEDFIEGIRAKTTEDKSIYYQVENGVFKAIAQCAKNDPSHNYVLIIDEINRGNISRIFGELITLLEDDKRAGCENELSVALPYSKERFTVPSNLYILGTMNTADRSLTQLDLALRRRFNFIEMLPKIELLSDINVYEQPISGILSIINDRIQSLLGCDHIIGHAYFMPLLNEMDEDERDGLTQKIFQQKILPLLREYFFDDWESILQILGENSSLLIRKKNAIESLSNQAIYSIDLDGLSKPEFYKGILKPYKKVAS